MSHWLASFAGVAAAIGATSGPSAIAAAFLSGVAAGARLAVGASTGWRSVPEIAVALPELGVPCDALQFGVRQVDGVIGLHGLDTADGALTVKLHGRDAFDDQSHVKLSRTLLYRVTAQRSASAGRNPPGMRRS